MVSKGHEAAKNRTGVDFLAFPASPSKPSLVQSTNTSITISWGKPRRVGNSPLREYQVEYFIAGRRNKHWVTASHVQGEKFSLENLAPGSSVRFLVRARNGDGLSPPSPLSENLSTAKSYNNDDMEHPKEKDNPNPKRELPLKQISNKLAELQEVSNIGPSKVRLSWKVTTFPTLKFILPISTGPATLC